MFTDPLFWALLSMLGLQGGAVVVTGHRLGRNLLFVTVTLTLVTIGRILLVLPFCSQPRFDLGQGQWVIAGAILLLTLVWCPGFLPGLPV